MSQLFNGCLLSCRNWQSVLLLSGPLQEQAAAGDRQLHEVGHRERLRKAGDRLQCQIHRPVLHDKVILLPDSNHHT